MYWDTAVGTCVVVWVGTACVLIFLLGSVTAIVKVIKENEGETPDLGTLFKNEKTAAK